MKNIKSLSKLYLSIIIVLLIVVCILTGRLNTYKDQISEMKDSYYELVKHDNDLQQKKNDLEWQLASRDSDAAKIYVNQKQNIEQANYLDIDK